MHAQGPAGPPVLEVGEAAGAHLRRRRAEAVDLVAVGLVAAGLGAAGPGAVGAAAEVHGRGRRGQRVVLGVGPPGRPGLLGRRRAGRVAVGKLPRRGARVRSGRFFRRGRRALALVGRRRFVVYPSCRALRGHERVRRARRRGEAAGPHLRVGRRFERNVLHRRRAAGPGPAAGRGARQRGPRARARGNGRTQGKDAPKRKRASDQTCARAVVQEGRDVMSQSIVGARLSSTHTCVAFSVDRRAACPRGGILRRFSTPATGPGRGTP